MVDHSKGANDHLLQMLVEEVERSDANRRGHVVVELAILTMLIDAKIVTIEEAAQRIELIQSKLPAVYQEPDVGLRVKMITEWLRGHAKGPPGKWRPLVIEGGLSQETASDQFLPKS